MNTEKVIELIKAIDDQPKMYHFSKWSDEILVDNSAAKKRCANRIAKIAGVRPELVTVSLEGKSLVVVIDGETVTMKFGDTIAPNEQGKVEKITPYAHDDGKEPVYSAMEFLDDMKTIWADGNRIDVVHSEGGSEGEGNYAERVFEVQGKFFRITGYYSSYDGTTWCLEDTGQVYPQQVTVTQYVSNPL